MFDAFDEKKIGGIDFDDFVHALSIFHPNTPLADKIDCKNFIKIIYVWSHLKIIYVLKYWLMYSHGWGGVILHAVSFRLYDLRQNGFIQREEVSLLVRLNHTVTWVSVWWITQSENMDFSGKANGGCNFARNRRPRPRGNSWSYCGQGKDSSPEKNLIWFDFLSFFFFILFLCGLKSLIFLALDICRRGCE